MLEIFSCEISERHVTAKKNAFLLLKRKKIFFSYNPHENFPAKNMKKYFFICKKYLFIFFCRKVFMWIIGKKDFFRFSKRNFSVTCLFRYFTCTNEIRFYSVQHKNTEEPFQKSSLKCHLFIHQWKLEIVEFWMENWIPRLLK